MSKPDFRMLQPVDRSLKHIETIMFPIDQMDSNGIL